MKKITHFMISFVVIFTLVSLTGALDTGFATIFNNPDFCDSPNCCNELGYDTVAKGGGCFNMVWELTRYCRENDICIFDCLDGYTLTIINKSNEWKETVCCNGDYIKEYNHTITCTQNQFVDITKKEGEPNGKKEVRTGNKN